LIDRKTAVIKDIPGNMARAMEKRQVEVVRGTAAFVAADTVRVGDYFLKAKHICDCDGIEATTAALPRR
jgi:glutathione reductase (NADPH)